MRKSWIRFSFAAIGTLAVIGSASAQSVNYWYNSFGDTATNQPSVINVTAGQNITLSGYVKTLGGVGPLSFINVLFGYSTTAAGAGSVTGATATRSDAGSPLVTFTSLAWSQGDMSSFITPVEGGGGGPANGTVRPYGIFATASGPGSGASPISNTGDGVNFHFVDVTLHISATDAPGTNIPINIWSFSTSSTSGTDNFASAVLNNNFTEYFPTQAYSGTLHVVAVPEPTSMAALAFGAIALIRRRRRSK